MYELLRKELRKKKCTVDVINGMPDHVHILLQLDASKSIASLLHQCKGASSNTINKEQWFDREFKWSVRLWRFFGKPILGRQSPNLYSKPGKAP